MDKIFVSGKIVKKSKVLYNKGGEPYILAYIKPVESELPLTCVLRGKMVKIAKNGILVGDSAMLEGCLVHGKKGWFIEVSDIDLYDFVRFDNAVEYNIEVK